MNGCWKGRLSAWLVIVGVALAGCASETGTPRGTDDRRVSITLLQLNDVYEMTPVEGGRSGGLARVATVRRELLAENPHTFTLLAGDLFSPSALGTAKVDGERLAGRQMVSVMNQVGLDVATFGNHEFDVKESAFLARLEESRFRWVAANAFDRDGARFPGVAPYAILSVPGPSGPVRVAVIGTMLDANRPDYVTYTDPIEAVREQVAALAGGAEVIIALTHLSVEQDRNLAQAVPEIDLILGGHEHENIQLWRGRDFTPIFKADANARTVYVHRVTYDTRTSKLTVESELRRITEAIADDPATARVVDRWVQAAFAGFRDDGFEPEQQVVVTPVELDGLESTVRNTPTLLAELIAAGMLRDAAGTELAMFNGGSVRIDDVLPPGPVTQYDVIRILPFGGNVLTVEIRGDVLVRVLEQGQANAGTGGYLQTAGVSQRGGGWEIGGASLVESRTYRVAMNDFLTTGKETGLPYLADGSDGVHVTATHSDIRKALIDELTRRWGGD